MTSQNRHLIRSLNDKDLLCHEMLVRTITARYLDGLYDDQMLKVTFETYPVTVKMMDTGASKLVGYETYRVIKHYQETGNIMTREQAYGLEK